MKSSRYDSAKPLRRELHWLPVKYRINFRILTYVYKSLAGTTPEYLSELLSLTNPVRSLRSSNSINFSVPRITSKCGEKAFSYAGPVLWNQLPKSIKMAETIIHFKKLLKTFYFRQAYNHDQL